MIWCYRIRNCDMSEATIPLLRSLFLLIGKILQLFLKTRSIPKSVKSLSLKEVSVSFVE